jgi:hypothetical protein
MANPFPDIAPDGPDGWQPDLGDDDIGQALDISANGIVQINVYDNVEPFRGRGSWKLLGPTDRKSIRDHHKANKASNAGFTLFDFFLLDHAALPCGTGNGTQTVFTIPAKATAGHTVKDNGSSVGGWTILVGTGADGEDQISFTTAPLNAHVITCDVTAGRKRYTVLYITRKWSLRWVEGDIWAVALEFVEKLF